MTRKKREVHNTHVLLDKKIYEKAKKKAKDLKIDMTKAIEIGLNYFATNATEEDTQ